MMRWGRKKPVSSSSSSFSSGLSRALPVSWFSKSGGSSHLKPAKEKKQDISQKMSTESSLSSTKRQNDINDSSKSFQLVSIEKENAATRSADMEFEDIMSSVRKKVRDFQRETCGFVKVDAMDKDKGNVIMTPRIQVNRDKQRCERRDQRLLEPKPNKSEQDAEVKGKKAARRTGTGSYSRANSVILGHTETQPAHQWKKLKELKLREVKLKADRQRKSLYLRRELNRLGTKENSKIKAIEDMKKAKLRARGDELVIAREDGGIGNESFAVVKCSSNPQKDFRDSMIEMIMENGINHAEELKELHVYYLRLNTAEYHDMIISVFQQEHNEFNFH